MSLRACFALVVFLLTLTLSAFDRTAAVLDLSSRISEGAAGRISLVQGMTVAGMPYIVTSDINDALAHPVVYFSNRIPAGILTDAESGLLYDYVEAGGIVVASYVTDSDLFDLFGVTSSIADNRRTRLTWNVFGEDPTLCWFDDDNEITISLGDPGYSSIFYTRGYLCDTAIPLGFYNDSSVAITRNDYGNGRAYLFGAQFRDISGRNSTNHDFDAERKYSNIFEPTSDTLFLWFREIFRQTVPHAAFLRTSPADTQSTLIISHDVDCFPAMNLMLDYADWEAFSGFRSSYFITTHYMTDWEDSDYYDPYIPQLAALCHSPHVVGSHSVGHFPDFMHEDIFPLGALGNTRTAYNPHYNGHVTTGGTVFGELEISRDLLNTDCGAHCTSFRAGYLYYNDAQFTAMDSLGYTVDSSFSANELLTHFPLFVSENMAMNGPLTPIITVPLTISDDDGMSALNYTDWIHDVWFDVFAKCRNNGAPTILLIHPTDLYKLDAEQRFYRMIPDDTAIIPLEDYAEFWRTRSQTHFTSEISDGNLEIVLPVGDYPSSLSWAVPDADSVHTVTVCDEAGTILPYSVTLRNGELLIHRHSDYFTENRWFPELTVSAPVNLGRFLPGDSLHFTVIASNTGTYPVRIDTLGFTRGNMVIAKNDIHVLYRGESDTLQVTFHATTPGVVTDTLFVGSNDINTPVMRFPVTAWVVLPSLPAPTGIQLTRTDSGFVLSWEPAFITFEGSTRNVDGYRVYAGDEPETQRAVGETTGLSYSFAEAGAEKRFYSVHSLFHESSRSIVR
jgi:hypothetical protein